MRKLPRISTIILILFIIISISALGISGCGKEKNTVSCNISTATPITGCPGDVVTFNGSNFGDSLGTVNFDGVSATIISWNDTSILVSSPGGDYSNVTVKPMLENSCSFASSYYYDNVAPSAPTITSPVHGVIIGTGAIQVTGTASNDLSSVFLGVNQGTWTETNPAVSGGIWSSTLNVLVAGAIVITATGSDDCGNIASNSVMVCLPPCVWYVNDEATGAGTGLSWFDAFTTIQAAIDVALIGGMVWVAGGTYTSDSTVPVLTMKYGIEIYGGFTGTETDLSQRDGPTTLQTILDGEDMTYHVVTGASNARLDGFTITGGVATLADCGEPEDPVEECKGGGMYNYNMTSLTVANCTFSDNWALIGGAMYNYDSSPTINNCIFSNNETNIGGGMLNVNSSPTINNCSFINNAAFIGGGAMYNYDSSPTITNCIIWGNGAPIMPEISLYCTSPSTLTISYSDVQGGPATGVYTSSGCTLNWGDGMIGALPEDDPLFVTGTNGDYYLSQPPGQGSTSPCVNTGSDTAENLGLDEKTTSTNGDLDAEQVDMGYHYEP